MPINDTELKDLLEETSPAASDIVYLATDEGGNNYDDKKMQLGSIPGHIVQVQETVTGVSSSGTTLTNIDNTIMQNNEGDQLMSVSITPTASINKIIVMWKAWTAKSNAGWVVGGMFQDSISDALACHPLYSFVGDTPLIFADQYEMEAGATSEITFKFRAGPADASTLYFNTISLGDLMGGKMNSFIRVMEIKA